jgi:adenine specific DNA methylase Mod
MAPRLVELRRVLKRTGSLYLHCDPTMSHYLKVLLDAIFGADHVVNEVIWKRSTAHSDSEQGAKHMGRLHDTILASSRLERFDRLRCEVSPLRVAFTFFEVVLARG